MPEKRERSEEKFDDDEVEADLTDVGCGNSSIRTTVGEDKREVAESSKKNQQFSPELLAQYYQRLFPFELLHNWLSYDPDKATDVKKKSITQKHNSTRKNQTFSHREFSFTIEGSSGEEIYIRYQCFTNHEELKSAVLGKNPRKIDIGAVFSHPPKDHNAIQGSSQRKFAPCQRELVFDVDLTDYDEVRKCGCSEAKICPKCWKMMGMAMKVMDVGLREDFGFKNIAWFYSGRRGVHAWVCDESARQLSDNGRSAVASYFEVNLGTEKNQNVDLRTPLHPMLQRAFKTLEPLFIRDIIPSSGHGILSSEDNWEELLNNLPSVASPVGDSLKEKWKKDGETTSAKEKWNELKKYLQVFIGKNTAAKKAKQAKNMSISERSKVELWPIATVFRYTYPRLDINVSKMQNHLLKSPFCVHPKTGRVCVPIDVDAVDNFDPFNVPILPQLMEELDSYEEREGKEVEYDWEKTSLKESFGYFQKKVLVPMWADLKRTERDKAEQRAAVIGDF